MSTRKYLMRTMAAAASIGSLAIGTNANAATDEQPTEPFVVVSADMGQISSRPIVAMGGGLNPLGGQIRTHQGNIDPLKGLIRTFEGDLDPFVGRIRTFVGDIEGQKGLIRTFEGDIDPFKGLIRTFWGDLTPTLGELDPKVDRIRTFTNNFLPEAKVTLGLWNTSVTASDHARVAAGIQQMIGQSEANWGVEIAKQTKIGFREGFTKDFLAKWRVDLANPSSLAGWSAVDRQRFILDWYDNVLNFSGMNRVDHWMNAINWTPKLTQTQGGGSDAIIGLVDFFIAKEADVIKKTVYSGGYTDVNNAHGAAVASLIVGAHDGQGVMGIAPKAGLAAYNPFDSTFTASWEDVIKGITAVAQHKASVINLSLGVPGQTLAADWRDVFRTSAIDAFKDKTIYVIAAGNDGVVQSNNIDFTGGFDSTFLVVGSIDPNGKISAFSNQPGTACLLDGGVCKNTATWNGKGDFGKTDFLKQSGLLMNRFLVAPGEMILVSDGKGGVTRMSGTSFAAPLVSGAIALIHDRWPWLKMFPREVAKILLESAQDLGAPGVDAVYGHGLLDIEAAQSALDFSKLKYYLVEKSNIKEMTVQQLQGTSTATRTAWSTSNLYFSAFEQLDSAQRDFLIPLSSRLYGSSIKGNMMQEYMHKLFLGWLGGSTFTGRQLGFNSMTRTPQIALSNEWSYSMYGRYRPTTDRRGFSGMKLHFTNEVEQNDGKMGFAFGNGNNAALLGGQPALQMVSDYDPLEGGSNPLLGFASGDTHAAGNVALSSNLTATLGWTERTQAFAPLNSDPAFSLADRRLIDQVGDYRAKAATVRVDYRPMDKFSFSMSYTNLKETGAFFGAQSVERNDFGKQTTTEGVTLSAHAEIGQGVSLFGSATVSDTASPADSTFRVKQAIATAYQFGLAKEKLFNGHDRLRASFTQPLVVEKGRIETRMVGVVDRNTGEKGIIVQNLDISAKDQRRHIAELVYSSDMTKSTQFNLFARGDVGRKGFEGRKIVAGASMTLAF